jgi:hypothetical protein
MFYESRPALGSLAGACWNSMGVGWWKMKMAVTNPAATISKSASTIKTSLRITHHP